MERQRRATSRIHALVTAVVAAADRLEAELLEVDPEAGDFTGDLSDEADYAR